MGMTLDAGLLDTDCVVPSDRNLNVIGCVVCTLAATFMLGSVITSLDEHDPMTSRMPSGVNEICQFFFC